MRNRMNRICLHVLHLIHRFIISQEAKREPIQPHLLHMATSHPISSHLFASHRIRPLCLFHCMHLSVMIILLPYS